MAELAKQESWDLVIKPGSATRQYWFDLWRYRELFFMLSWRDISVSYKQTIIGVLWAGRLETRAHHDCFTIVFGKIAKLPSDGQVPYADTVEFSSKRLKFRQRNSKLYKLTTSRIITMFNPNASTINARSRLPDWPMRNMQ